MKVAVLGPDALNKIDVTLYSNVRLIDTDNPLWLHNMYLLPNEIIALENGENVKEITDIIRTKFNEVEFLLV